jgi:hypothetical protein
MGHEMGFHPSVQGPYATHFNIELWLLLPRTEISFLFAGRSDGDEMIPPVEGRAYIQYLAR